MKFDPAVIGVLVDVGRVLWHAVTGTSEDRKEAALAIAEAALQAGLEEAKRRAEQLGLVISFIELDLTMQRMLAGIREAEKHPRFGLSMLNITEVGPDEKLVDTVVTEVPDPEPKP